MKNIGIASEKLYRNTLSIKRIMIVICFADIKLIIEVITILILMITSIFTLLLIAVFLSWCSLLLLQVKLWSFLIYHKFYKRLEIQLMFSNRKICRSFDLCDMADWLDKNAGNKRSKLRHIFLLLNINWISNLLKSFITSPANAKDVLR